MNIYTFFGLFLFLNLYGNYIVFVSIEKLVNLIISFDLNLNINLMVLADRFGKSKHFKFNKIKKFKIESKRIIYFFKFIPFLFFFFNLFKLIYHSIA